MRIFPRNFASLAIGIFNSFTTFASVATRLPPEEVAALKEIGKTLGKTDWDFSVDPCTFSTERNLYGFEDSVTCNPCNDTVCHITRIALKAQDLQGTLPPELVRLTHLEDIDLSRNYLNGTIPPEWGSMKLVNISLEFNQLSGPIPPELGSLPRLWKLHLTSNYFTGELPKELAKLTTLKDLDIQSSGLDGPIPPGIGLLTKLSDLRISDLNGSQASFPPLNNLTSLKNLFLRSCNINGTLPEYLGTMTKLKILDLSFNNLSGEIPSNFIDQTTIEMMYGYQHLIYFLVFFILLANWYLTENLLSGPVPSWMLQTSTNIDLSYNNFSLGSSQDCQQRNTGNGSCLTLRGFSCDRKRSSFHINCGGKEVSIDGNKYERDRDEIGPSNYYRSTTNWAFSSTGNFMDDDRTDDPSILTNSSRLSVHNSELYMDARISPISLTYYGFCLVKGNYDITLHFAEIMFNDGKSYSSLGRRIFDIYIQGKRVQKNFNIDNEAGGIGKEVIKKYTAKVTDGTLEIRFYWAGKGTTGLPTRGVYGPLISAISVDNLDYEPPKGISAGAVVGIMAAAAFVIILLLGILWWRGFLIRKDTMDQDLKGLDLQTGSFTLRQIKAATNNFDEANKIGEGDFGSVYESELAPFELGGDIDVRIEKKVYMAPKYAMHGYLIDKVDVYSFGIVALEIVSGRSDTSYRTKEYCLYLLDWALVLKQKGDLMELVDPTLGSDFNKIEVTVMINVALLCTNVSPIVRPAMSSVVSMLEGRTVPASLVNWFQIQTPPMSR
ncbi:hypothetical protein RHMOL_Rhmol04G0056900 [Rhododendron molle]|uniref:Uncharacterized protein n=1 Tax=Rhododendron molle TaxID=49168 RepID=A0ACC0NXC3_RHOML|nr:hypothetical protein RHMOL_Rhmol04G0056900 [Rhododendron molle]